MLNRPYEKKFDRWLSDTLITTHRGDEFLVCITIKNSSDEPDSAGVATIENLIKGFNFYWEIILTKLLEFNINLSQDLIENSVKNNIFVYAPALVGSTTYELMVLLDLMSDAVQEQSCVFCFNDNKLVFSEKHI